MKSSCGFGYYNRDPARHLRRAGSGLHRHAHRTQQVFLLAAYHRGRPDTVQDLRQAD